MNWKKAVSWTLGIVVVVGLGTLGTFKIMDAIKDFGTVQINSEERLVSLESGKKDYDQEVVNKPVEKSAVTLADGTDGHSFIAKWHTFYNETLCFGGIETTSHEEQAEAAAEILHALDGYEAQYTDIGKDLKSIQGDAKTVSEVDDREAMIRLHRMFHDLDIYFNGYSYHETFGITQFTGE